MNTIQGKAEKFDIVEQCTIERQNTKWRFKQIKNITVFSTILKKSIPMGCPDSVLPEPLLKYHSVNCLLSDKENNHTKFTFAFSVCALTMYLHGRGKLDAHTPQLFTEFVSKSGYDPKNFRGVAIDDLAPEEGIVERKLFFHDFDIQE